MRSIWYDSIEDILLNIADPNTWGTISNVPWVSSPKINAWTSVYNIEAEWWSWIAWWTTNISRTASDYNTVAWGSWYIYLPDWTSLSVTSGNTGNMSAVTYIYYDQSDNAVHTTTSAADSVWEDKILMCVAAPTVSWKSAEFQAFGTNAQSTFITADNVAASTITANDLIWNTITGRTVQTASSWQRFVMSSSDVAQYDSSWTKRVEYKGNWITFYDSNWIQTSSLVWQNGAIHTTNFDASYIDAYSVSTEELDVTDAATLKYVTISSSGDLDCKGTAEFSKKLKIPVGTNLY